MASRMPFPGITCTTTSFPRFRRHGVTRSGFFQHSWHCWGSSNRTGHRRTGRDCSGSLCSRAVSRHSVELQSGDSTFSGVLRGGTIHCPFSATETKLAQFVAWLYRKNLSGSTEKNYVAAVRHSHIAMGLGDPQIGSMPQQRHRLDSLSHQASCKG